MQKSKKKIEPVPEEFETLMEASDFWDTHDISEYWNMTSEAKFKVSMKREPKYVALENDIAMKVFNIAKKKHVSAETIINLWLREKLSATR